MCSLLQNVFSVIECVLLLQNVFSYYRMCSLLGGRRSEGWHKFSTKSLQNVSIRRLQECGVHYRMCSPLQNVFSIIECVLHQAAEEVEAGTSFQKSHFRMSVLGPEFGGVEREQNLQKENRISKKGTRICACGIRASVEREQNLQKENRISRKGTAFVPAEFAPEFGGVRDAAVRDIQAYAHHPLCQAFSRLL